MPATQESLIVELALRAQNWISGLTKSTESTNKFKESIDNANKSSQSMRDELGRFIPGAKKAFDEPTKKANEYEKATKKAATTTGQLKSAILALAGAVGGGLFFKSAIDDAREFDRLIRQIATVSPVGSQNIAQLKNEVEQIGLKFGFSGKEAAKGFYDILAAGVPADKAKVFTEDVARLAKAGSTTFDESAKLLLGTINSFGLAFDQAKPASDALLKATDISQVSLTELSQTIGDVAPLASSAGISIVEMVSAISALRASGISTSEAGTQFVSMVKQIVAPTDEAASAAKALGIEFNDVALRAKGFPRFIAEIGEATKGSISTTNQLFNRLEGAKSILSLTGAQAKLFASGLNDVALAGGKVEENLKIMQEGIDEKFRKIEAAVNVGKTAMGLFILETTVGIDGTAESINVAQLRIRAFFKQVEVGVGFAINLFKRAYLGISDIAQEIINLGAYVYNVATLGFRQASAIFVNAEKARDRAMRNGLAGIEKTKSAIETSAIEANRLYAEADSLTREIADNRKNQLKTEKDISQQLKTQNSIEKDAAAKQKYNQQQFDAQQFFNSGTSTRQALFSNISAARSQFNLSSAETQSLIDFVEKSFDKATKQADLDEIGIRLGQKIETFQIKAYENAQESAEPEIRESTRDSYSRAIGDGVRDSIPEITEIVSENLTASYRAAGIEFQRTGQGFGLAQFTVPGSGSRPYTMAELALQNAQRSQIFDPTSFSSGSRPIGFASGGQVPGQGNRDSIPAMLMPGEFVINKSAASMFLPMLQSINRMNSPMQSPTVNTNVNLGGMNISNGAKLDNETIDKVIIPRIRFMLRMGR